MVNELSGLIPIKYRANAFGKNHIFCISNLCWHSFELIRLANNDLRVIEPCAYCEYNSIRILIPIYKKNKIANSIMELGQIAHNGRMNSKYLDLYKIFEVLPHTNHPHLAALRHAVAHSPKLLNNPNTINALMKSFGTLDIDLTTYKHQKIYWQLFAELLIQVDSLIGKLISTQMNEMIILGQNENPIFQFSVSS